MPLLRLRRIEHVERDANSSTYKLARKTATNVVDNVWLEEISNCIYDIIIEG